MKQLYSARSGLDAHELRLFLESHGIAAKVIGDNPVLESIGAFTPASAPSVFVDDVDIARATELLDEFVDEQPTPVTAGTWTCTSCGKRIESQFHACWNCETPRGDTPIKAFVVPPILAVEPQPSILAEIDSMDLPEDRDESELLSSRDAKSTLVARELWLEVIAVLTICWLPFFVQSALDLYLPRQPSNRPYVAKVISTLPIDLSLIVVVLYIAYRSGEPWKTFGICRPRVLRDVAFALAAVALAQLVFHFSVDVIMGLVDVRSLRSPTAPIAAVTSPTNALQWVAAAIRILFGAFSEELICRGYLIGRFKRLFGSTLSSVILSSVIYGLGHIYQGWDYVFITFMSGIAYSCVFCLSGRIWPTFLAHAYHNFLVTLRY